MPDMRGSTWTRTRRKEAVPPRCWLRPRGLRRQNGPLNPAPKRAEPRPLAQNIPVTEMDQAGVYMDVNATEKNTEAPENIQVQSYHVTRQVLFLGWVQRGSGGDTRPSVPTAAAFATAKAWERPGVRRAARG